MLESPRYLLQKGEVKKAINILARVLSWNGYELPPGQLVTQDEKDRIMAKQGDKANISEDCSVHPVDCQDEARHHSYGTINSKEEVENTVVPESVRAASEKHPLLDSSKVLVCQHLSSIEY